VRSPDRLAGLAHVATCSFLAARLAPSGQFFVALAGGVALARAGSVHGLRAGYGASAAAVAETVALIGPARVNGPLTQAFNAPLVGRMDARGFGFPPTLAACLAIRLVHYALLNVLFVWLVVGGFDAFVDTYDRIAGFVNDVIGLLPGVEDPLPKGGTAAVLLTVALNLALAVFYSSVQVLAYRRALRRWTAPPGVEADTPEEPGALRPPKPGRTAILVALVTLATWVAMLGWLSWPLLAVVAGLVAVACVPLGRERLEGMRLGLALAAVFAVGAIGPAVVGAVPWDAAAQRAVRAALLVLTATWARGAAGADGVRSLFGALLWGIRVIPGAREAAALTAVLRSDRRLTAAGKDLLERLDGVETKVLPVADALTEWVAAESSRAPA
jgi:hypothetical protein